MDKMERKLKGNQRQSTFLIWILISVQCTFSADIGDICGLPNAPVNGEIVVHGRYRGATVQYICNEGYWYTGTGVHVCQNNGRWSGEIGYCKEVQCPDLEIPRHGSIISTGSGYKRTASVRCDEGYSYSIPNNVTIVCQNGGQWSSSIGVCREVECPALSSPQYGKITYSGKGFEDTAHLQCDDGYMYSEPEAAKSTCQIDNRWNPHFNGECQKIICPPVPQVKYGFASTEQRDYGITVTYTCLQGYNLLGSKMITCNAKGNWSGDPKECITLIDTNNRHTQFESNALIIGLALHIGIFILLAYLVVMKMMGCHRERCSEKRQYSPIIFNSDNKPPCPMKTTADDVNHEELMPEDEGLAAAIGIELKKEKCRPTPSSSLNMEAMGNYPKPTFSSTCLTVESEGIPLKVERLPDQMVSVCGIEDLQVNETSENL